MLQRLAIFAVLFVGVITDVSALKSAHAENSSPSPSAAQSQWSNWQSMHQLYESGKFEEAFQALNAQPSGNDPSYFYNLGTISFRLGRTGAALGYFEKANRLKRHDPDIYHNLEMTRAALEKTLGPGKLDPASDWTETLADQVSLEEIRGVFGALMLILAVFWIQTYRKNRDVRQTLLRPAALIGAVALALVGGLYWVETLASARTPAVAMSRQPVRSGPGESYVELAQVDAGTKVRLLGNSDDWLQIRYSQDGIGWVRAKEFLLID
jgi:tetratricopeptide (TPR) repeat protein